MDYKVIGTRPIRHDGTDKVTGVAVYGVDVTLPGVLCGKVLRSPHAHARIRSIDISRAKGYEGVKAVIVGEDLQAPNLLAVGKVLFDGHGVVAVAAVNAQVAEEALELLEVEYEVLTPVLDVRQAMREDAVLLHEEMRTESLGEKTDTKSNIAKYFQHIMEDVEQGMVSFPGSAVIGGDAIGGGFGPCGGGRGSAGGRYGAYRFYRGDGGESHDICHGLGGV